MTVQPNIIAQLRDPTIRTTNDIEALMEEASNRLELAIIHMVGDECPDCHCDSIIHGCAGSSCVLCNWQEIIEDPDEQRPCYEDPDCPNYQEPVMLTYEGIEVANDQAVKCILMETRDALNGLRSSYANVWISWRGYIEVLVSVNQEQQLALLSDQQLCQ